MKKINEKVLKAVERLMRDKAKHSVGKFLSPCLGILHQPKKKQ